MLRVPGTGESSLQRDRLICRVARVKSNAKRGMRIAECTGGHRVTSKSSFRVPQSAFRISHFFLKFVPDRRKVGILLSDVPERLVQPKTCAQIRLGLIEVTKDSFITT